MTFRDDILNYNIWQDAPVRRAMKSDIDSLTQRLLPHAAKLTGITLKDFRRRLREVTLIEAQDVNGFARSTDNWKTFEIGINEGLVSFFFKMASLFVSRFAIRKERGRTDTPISLESTAAVARDLMQAFWEGRLSEARGFDSLIELNAEQNKHLFGLTGDALCFTIAHELGHIIARIVSRIPELGIYQKFSEDQLRTNTSVGQAEIRQVAEAWSHEFTADHGGLHLLMSATDGRHSAFGAVELVFIMQIMLERYYSNYYKKTLSFPTHPPSMTRLAVLQLGAKRGKSSAVVKRLFMYSEAFEGLANMIMDEVFK